MHPADTENQFLELRAKGWSLARIASHIKVSQRTLVQWNRNHQLELQTLRSVAFEALKEKILTSQEEELTRLNAHLNRIEQELSTRPIRHLSTSQLYHLAALLRAEIRKITQPTDLPGQALTLPPPALA